VISRNTPRPTLPARAGRPCHDETSSPHPRGLTPVLTLLVALITLAVYLPTARHNFLDWDDQDTVAANPDFIRPATADWSHYWTQPYIELYMPLTYTFWGMLAGIAYTPGAGGGGSLNPAVFHFASAALHAISATLIFWILVRLARNPWAALLGAMVFALHPLQVESVAWVTSTSIVLSGALSLWAIWEYLCFDQLRLQSAPGKHFAITWSHYGLGTLAFALALLSKPSAVVVPVVVGVILLGLQARKLNELRPLFAWLLMCVPIALITRAAQATPAIQVPLTHRVPVALDALAFYLAKVVLPVNLIPDYGRTPAWLFAHSAVRYTFLVPVLLAAICLLLRHKMRCLGVGAGVFAIALLPVLGLTPFLYQKYSTVADRYVYLSMLGPALVIACLTARLPRAGVGIVTLILGLLLGAATFAQADYWKDTVTLFEHTLTRNPNSLGAHDALAHWYAAHGDPEKSLSHDRAALSVDPRYGRVLYNMGNTLSRLGRFPEAVAAYRAAATESDLSTERKAVAFDNMGIAYLRNGDVAHVSKEDLDRAAESFRAAISLSPEYAPARQHLDKLESLRRAR
jgi:protein O-mannosyl-transferase